jgi:hypothetical protein
MQQVVYCLVIQNVYMSDIPLHTLVDDYDITPVINTNNGYNYYLCTDCLTL